MEYRVERKISLIHAAAGTLLGLVSPFVIPGTLTLVSVIIVGFLLAYPLYILTKKSFNLSEKEFTLKDWLGKGYLYFFAAWILVWTLFYNFLIA
ncbi:MAG: hypothetical protein GXO66_08425 [Euryarchaeota archaeon]|nr:hypothetical protein [Euryarchaeota archaeon]